MATAWQFGRGGHVGGVEEAMLAIKCKAQAKATETPGVLTQSARSQQHGLLCYLSRSSPSSRQIFNRWPQRRYQYPGLHHERARWRDVDMSSGSLCHPHYVEQLLDHTPAETVHWSIINWSDRAQTDFTTETLIQLPLPTPLRVVIRPLFTRQEEAVTVLVKYCLGQTDESLVDITSFPWFVKSYAAYRQALAGSQVTGFFRRGDGMSYTARRVRDLTAVIRSSWPSIDKIHHIAISDNGVVVQHAQSNIQLIRRRQDRPPRACGPD